MTDSRDPDRTEVDESADTPTDADATEASTTDYTEFGGATTSTSTGFEKARTLAVKASQESGRLLKKRFVLEDELGAGGMGVVYKARDLRKVEAEDSNPYIAAKVLGAQFKDHPHAFVSLQQEAVKSQKLAHPNVVTVHDFDRDGDTIFMTMELLKGDPLDNLLKIDAPFSKDTCVRYFTELCSGLEYAHKRGLIHSDFKPGNIFVTTGGSVKILDFGIARAANLEASSDFDAGELGALTPAYATVEMVKREDPSFSDDVYALACVLYYMLTGRHPYKGRSAADAQKQELKAERPEGLDNREWQALSTALNTHKDRRPSTVAEFRDAFLPAPKKRGGMAKTLVAILLLVVAGAGWLGFRQYQLAAEQEAAVAQKRELAKNCFYQRDYRCAIDNARVVLSLSPGDAEAQTILQGAGEALQQDEQRGRLENLLLESSTCLEQGDLACAQVKARDVLELEPGQPQARQLLEEIANEQRKQAIGGFLEEANACLLGGDIDCAEMALAGASAAGAQPAELYELRRRSDALAAQQASEQQARQTLLTQQLERGQRCLEAGDTACALDAAQAVLAIDSSNSAAIALQQSVKISEQRRATDEATVARILGEAQDCFDARNYSCAIAKSESALAILPRSTAAAALRDRAQKAQTRAKRTITIE